jgi:iron-sulfur cluster assembly protein
MGQDTTQQTAERPTSPQGIIYVSEKAARYIRTFAEKEGRPVFGLRVAVKGGGCSGLKYSLGFEEAPKAGDKVIEHGDVKLLVDTKSLLYLAGMTLDFSDGLNGKGFVFENPNAKSVCGCGTSFSV